jgi:vitamin B12/bleomycin/antimicrobial peptide transport system ATP-binding/permease protein
MKILSIVVLVFGAVAVARGIAGSDPMAVALGVAALACAATTFLSATMSRFLRIFVAIFSAETVVFGLAVLAATAGLWPAGYAAYAPPVSLPITVALFSVGVFFVARLPGVRAATRIADPYFEQDERGTARIWPLPSFAGLERHFATAMVVVLVVLHQAQVGILVRISFINRDGFNAIQAKDAATFWHLLFAALLPWVLVYVTCSFIEFLTQSMLVIRWRRWLTDHFVGRWLANHAHYRMTLVGAPTDNPDQRIADDVHRFIDGAGGLGIFNASIVLISTLSSLLSFTIVLWGLSASFTLLGTDVPVPGLLFWVALIYALIGTLVTHLIGRTLVKLFVERQRAEADYRFSLARLREYGEQIALLSGEDAERSALRRVFGGIVANYLAVVDRRKKLTAFTTLYNQIAPILPLVTAAPFYFSGKIGLGVLTQTAGAFARVDSALTFFIHYYTSLAGFRSVIERLNAFDAAIEAANARSGAVRVAAGTALRLDDVTVALPDGRRVVVADKLTLARRESVLIAGPSGAGKSTLFRAISGIWPFAAGRIHIPQGARVMVVPQKPYVPMGTLRAAVCYPAAADAFDDEVIRAALADVRLDDLAGRLDCEEAWGQRLSGGEQQRLALARALLARPDWLLLDESTSAVDEPLEAALYAVIARRLPDTTVLSIGHRSTLTALHARRLDMVAERNGRTVLKDAACGREERREACAAA